MISPDLRTRVRDWWGKEIVSIMLVAIAASAVFAFAQIADEVSEGDTKSFDEAVLTALRSADDPAQPIGPIWVQEMFQDFTSLGSVAVLTLIVIATIGYLLVRRKPAMALFVAIAVGLGTGLGTLLKDFFERPRPEIVAHLVDVRTLSFPSGHSMMSAVVFLTLAALLIRTLPQRREKAYMIVVAITLTLLVGASRVYLGVHYPTDVLAGWSIGAAWALLSWVVAIRLQRRGDVEPEIEPPARKSGRIG